jgi:hypothetical protein
MSFAMEDAEAPARSSKKSSAGGFALLALLFFPATLLATGVYMLLRKGRQRLSVIAAVCLFLLLAAAAVFFWGDAWPRILETIQQWEIFLEGGWQGLIPLAIVVNLALGALAGFIICVAEVHQMKVNPHRLRIPGNWMYGFKYRRTPLQLLKRKRTIRGLKEGWFSQNDKAPLGLDETHEDSVTYRYDTEAAKMSLVVGASGSGKTITLLSLILADIQSGKPSFVLDFKRSPEMAAKLSAWCKENDVEFYHFVNGPPDEYDVKDSFGQCTYDPLGAGSPTSKADMVLNMREWDTASAIYRANNQQLLQIVFSMLNQADRNSPALYGEVPYDGTGRRILNMDEFLERSRTKTLVKRGYSEHMASGGDREGFSALAYLQQAGEYRMEVESFIDWKSGGIYQLYSAIRSTETLKALCTACGETPIEQQAEELKALLNAKEGAGLRAALSEVQGQMRTIVASDYGRWMKTGGEERSIDLLELSQKPNTLVLFSLNSDSEKDFSRYVGSMILSDFTALSAKRRNAGLKNLINIYVDEFQAVPPTSVTSLLEKARESRMALTLAQQSFEQIIAASERNGEAYLLSILDTCSNFIVHNGMTEDSATRLSKILGKHHETIYRQANQNQSFFLSMNWANRRNQMIHTGEEERWIFEPRRFMSLSSPDRNNGFKATAVLVNKTSADPRFKGREGALARTVWMLPNSKVIDEYYTPTFRDAGERAIEAPPVSDSLEEPPVSLKSPAMLSFQPYSVDEDEPTFYDEEQSSSESYRSEEEEDGSFGWSMDGEDAQEPEGLLDASPALSYPPQSQEFSSSPPPAAGSLPTFSSPPQRNSQESRRRAVTDLFSQDFKPQRLKDLQKAAPVSAPAPSLPPEQQNTGLPQLSPQQGGLPTLPPLPPRTGGLPRLPGP